MRIKKLEIFGFKSFANRQSIVFGEGVTGVVGPNGCGKSNVVDALRWVMGEQNARHLRGGNMQDIIFCGSEKKAPLGFAEVTLTIENNKQDAPLEYNHYNEIEITRRLYKTGDSEYEINRQKARLKDISDFFLGTGVGTKAYSIIEQGKVQDVISAKPNDRRLIIEEAAGITKYKAKKAQAERRMDATRGNLNRIIDIKNEVDKRVLGLLREKEKLEKVLALKMRIREIDLHIASHRYLARSSELSFLNRNKETLNFEIREINREIACVEQIFEKILQDYAKKHDQKRLLEELEIQHKTSLELFKKDLEHLKRTLEDNTHLIHRLLKQLDDLSARETELISDIDRTACEHSENLDAYKNVRDNLSKIEQDGQSVVLNRQRNISEERDTQKKILEAATAAARLQSEITVLTAEEAQKELDIKNAQYELSKKHDEHLEQKRRIDSLNQELSQGILRKKQLEAQFLEKESTHKKEVEFLNQKKKELRGLEEEQIKVSSRLKSLREIESTCAWSEGGISELLNSDVKHLLKAVVADTIRVRPGHEDIVEKCLGHMLDAAVLVSSEALNSITCFIKSNKIAKTSFLLLSNNDMQTTFAKPIGLKCLSDFIQIQNEEYAGLSQYFSRFFLASDLINAIDHWPAARIAHATIVSEAGEVLLPDGRAIILGQDNNKGVLKRKNEVLSLEAALSKLQTSIKDLAVTVAHGDAKVSSLRNEKEHLIDEQRLLSLGVVRLEETIKQKQIDLKKIEHEIKSLGEKEALLKKTKTSFDERIVKLNKSWSDALEDHKNLEESLLNIRSERTTVEAAYEAHQLTLKEIEIKKAALHEKTQSLATTLAQAKKNLEHLLSQKKDFHDQVDEKTHEELKLKEGIRQNEQKIAALMKELDETLRMLANVRLECAEITAQKLAQEEQLGVLASKGRVLKEKIHEQELLINNANNEIKNVCDRISERYRIRLIEQLIDFHLRAIHEPSAKKEMEDLERQKDRIGAVNENASSEYEEFSKRSKFLEEQVNDLNDALNQLESAIKKINKTTRLRFLEAFHAINKQFSQVFPRLFNGGKAELVLINEEELLNCGVDIIAKPPGKNIGSIELMSGGEKALTAISLIMAIFLIKPSPFCLLDEVDAPLDEANVARFSYLVKEISQLSQFIVITHNRKTMESADQLYGVTMEDAGMSKIVSVHVQQAFDALKEERPAQTKSEKPTQMFLNDI